MILSKFYARDLNVTYWTLRQEPGLITLRPTWRVAATRLLLTFLLWLISAGWVGVDYELEQLVERRRFDPGQLADMEKRAVDEGDRLRKSGQPDQARQAEQSMRSFSAEIVRRRNMEIAQLEASQLPWRILLLSLAAGGFLLGIIAPLSVLWQRVKLHRDGDELVVRKIGLWTRTRRVSAHAARHPEIGARAQMAPEGANIVSSYAWGLRIADPDRAILFWVKATQSPNEPPSEVHDLARAIAQLVNN